MKDNLPHSVFLCFSFQPEKVLFRVIGDASDEEEKYCSDTEQGTLGVGRFSMQPSILTAMILFPKAVDLKGRQLIRI